LVVKAFSRMGRDERCREDYDRGRKIEGDGGEGKMGV
jgi:hypothetical protein